MSGSDEKGKPHLRIIKSDEAEEPEPSDMQVKLDADAILGNAVMYAAMSWVSCCMEEQGEAVSVMPLGGGLFDAEVRLVGGRSIWLRAGSVRSRSPVATPRSGQAKGGLRLVLEAGPVLQTRIEPVHP